MVRIFALVAFVFSLWTRAKESFFGLVGIDGLDGNFGFEGSVFKAKPEYSTPRSVKIHWVNAVEGGAPNGFNMITESNDINETNFKISVNKYIHMTFFKLFQFLMSVF